MDLMLQMSDFHGLVTELCKSLIKKHHPNYLSIRDDNTRIINKMRTTAFAIILNKHHVSRNINDNQKIEMSDPVAELLKYSFVLKSTGNSFSTASKLENALDKLMDDDGNYDSTLKPILNFLFYLKSYQSVDNDPSELFNFGGTKLALQMNHQWNNEVPQYQIYPLSTLELPIKINKLLHTTSHEFNVDHLQAPIKGLFQLPLEIMHNEFSFTSPLTPLDNFKPTYNINEANCMIHGGSNTTLSYDQQEIEYQNDNSNHSSPISTVSDIYLSTDTHDLSPEIDNRTWETLGNAEILKQSSFVLDSSIAMEYFENFRNLSSFSGEFYMTRSRKYNIISMERFIENTKLVLQGIDSNCYVWNNALGFTFDVNITVSGLSRESLQNICSDVTHWATCFKLLTMLVHPNPESGELRQDGLIFMAMCNNIKDILIHYQAAILQVFNQSSSVGFINLLHRLRDIGLFISEVARLCRCDQIRQAPLVEGTGILSHIYNQVTKITKPKIALVYYSVLKSCCEVYFQLLEKWIFEGICDESHDEFMIKIRGQYLRNRGHKFWTRCFGIKNEAVPGFLKNLTDSILQCGKAVRLLKICDPKNPICNLFTIKRPTIKVCLNMNMLCEQEKICSQYMADGVKILGPNVTLSSAFREIKALEKERAQYVIAAQHETLEQIKRNQKEAKIQLEQNKRELLADQKKQCEDAVSRREKAKEMSLMEDKLLMEQQQIEDDKFKSKQLADTKITVEYYKELAREANKRRLRATWRAQRMALFDERMNAITMALLSELDPVINEQPIISQNNHVHDIHIEDENIILTSSSSNQEKSVVESKINDKNCNSSDREMNQQHIINTNEMNRSNRPKNLNIVKNNTKILENETLKNTSTDAMFVQTEVILNEIRKNNNLINNTKNTLVIETSDTSNGAFPSDNNDNVIIFNEQDNENESINNIEVERNLNDIPMNRSEESQFPQLVGSEINDATPMSCTTDSYVPSAVGSSVLYNCTEVGSFGESKNEFETPTTPGDCRTSAMKQHFSIENIFTRSNTQCFNPFDLSDSSPVDFESSLTKADVEIIDNTSLQIYLEKSVFIPLRVQSQLANSAIVKCFLHDHKILQHFQSLRSFFFLLNGEFAKNLTGPLYTKFYEISLPIELFNSHTLTNLLKNALHCSLNNTYINSELLSLTVFEHPSVKQILDPQALNCLCLHYKVTWPLNIIIDEALMQQYSKVFKFLLMVGRVLWVLQEDFCILKNERKAATSHQYHQVQLYRHAMMQFMTALHNYITCSVLHASWTEFEKELENATTLDQIYTTHVSYIKKILSRCMLTNRGEKLRICLCNTFEIILKFHNCLRSYEWIANSTSYIHPNYKKLQQMYDAFCTLRTYPAQVVDRSACSGYQMHLSHFVDALNINPLFNL